MSVQFRCNLCSKRIKAPNVLGGKRVACPHCQQTIEVPSVEEDEDFLSDFDEFLNLDASQRAQTSSPPPPPPSQPQSTGPKQPSKSLKIDTGPAKSRTGHRNTREVRSTRSQKLQMIIAGTTAVLYVLLVTAIALTHLADSRVVSRETMIESLMTIIFGPLFIVAAIIFYFAPTMVAYVREHQNSVPIMIINIVFGITVLGWVAALAWACSSDVRESRQHIRQVVVHEPYDSNGR